MNGRLWTIALAASVALNVFGAAALITTLVGRDRVEQRVAAAERQPREGSAMAIVRDLDPEVRRRVRQALRDSALAARPDFELARAKRREAVELARAPTYDAARVTALLGESRDAELRGRGRLEADAAILLGTLEPDDRAALSKILTRRGRERARDDQRGSDQAARAVG